VHDAVVGGVGGGERRVEVLAVALHAPVERAPVDQDSGQGGAVAAVVLGGGDDDDVGTQLQGTDQVRGGRRVVHDQRRLVPVGDLGDGRDVEHVVERVGDRLGV